MTENKPRDKVFGQAAAALGIGMLLSVGLLATRAVPASLTGWLFGVAGVCLFGVLGIGVLTLKGFLRVAVVVVLALAIFVSALTLLGPAVYRMYPTY
jgi:hypothetical protein